MRESQQVRCVGAQQAAELRPWLFFVQRSGMVTALAVAGFVVLLFAADGATPPVPLLCFVVTLTASAYGIDRVKDCGASRTLRVSFACLATLVLATTVLSIETPARPRLLLMVAVILAAVVAYSFPLLPAGQRVKDVPFFKSFYVGLTWVALLAACLPTRGAKSAFILALVYTRVVLGAIASDIKDVEEDRSHGLITFPVRFGVQATFGFLARGHAVLAGTYGLAVITGLLPLPVLLGGVDAALAGLALRWISQWRPAMIGLGTDLLLEGMACLPLLGLLL